MHPIVIRSNRHLNGWKLCRIEFRANRLDGNLGAIRLQLGNWHEKLADTLRQTNEISVSAKSIEQLLQVIT